MRKTLTEYILENYNTEEEHPFARYPEVSVFRHQNNGKWFAIIMEVEKRKLGINEEGITTVVNFKSDPILILSHITREGLYPAYHMNKTHWFSAILNGRVPEQELFSFCDISYLMTK